MEVPNTKFNLNPPKWELRRYMLTTDGHDDGKRRLSWLCELV